jgi:hypothetical protein
VRRALPLLAILFLASSCGPRLKGEAIAGRTVMITNDEQEPLVIRRIVANDSDGRAECVEEPAAELGPGRSHTVTFFYCDEVREVDVETDQGTRELHLG